MTMFVKPPRSRSPRVLLYRVILEIEALIWKLTR